MAEKKKTARAARPAKASKSQPPVAVETVAVQVAPVETVAVETVAVTVTQVETVEPVAVEVAPLEAVAVETVAPVEPGAPVEPVAPLSEAAVERIRARARALWEARGGNAFDNWLEAERAVRAEVQATA